MRRTAIVIAAVIICSLVQIAALAQQDKLAGRWEGKLQSPQGERPTTVVFKKEGDAYSGKTLGMRPGTEIELKDVKIDGDKVTAKADIETPQGGVTINYTFTLAGEAMKGAGAIDFGGQNFTFDIELKRVSGDISGALAPQQAPAAATQAPAQASAQSPAAASPGAGGGQGQRQRGDVAQPQQKQSIDYFVGQWSFKYVGRESALWQAPREGVITFTKRADGKSADGVLEGKHEGGAFRETWVLSFDEATKMLTVAEKLSNGTTLSSRGDWSSPISIRFAVDPVKIKNQSLQLRRTISVISAHSFGVAEELSEDGGPFVRLGSAVFSKAGGK